METDRKATDLQRLSCVRSVEVVKAVEQLEIKQDGPAFFSCSILFDGRQDVARPYITKGIIRFVEKDLG